MKCLQTKMSQQISRNKFLEIVIVHVFLYKKRTEKRNEKGSGTKMFLKKDSYLNFTVLIGQYQNRTTVKRNAIPKKNLNVQHLEQGQLANIDCEERFL